MSAEKRLKRDNWTNAEVIALIEGQQICKGDGTEDDWCKKHNQVVQMVAEYFRSHFACPPDDFSALSLDTESGIVYHTGTVLPS